MKQKHIYESNFYSDIFEKNMIPSVYEKIKLKGENETFYKPQKKILPASKIYSFEFVPDYLELKVNEEFVYLKIFQKYGYAINLSNYSSAEDYIKAKFKTSLRKNFNRIKNKLESCYNIRYSVFYGDINNEQYNSLMKFLYIMLEKRFQERNDRNRVIENWEYYVNNSLNLINTKKASLFVIYSDKTPIAITLNYHHEKIMYSAIASYDLDFSKFSLGSNIIYKLVEWAFLNNYKLIDLGYGDFSHKQMWCNSIYNFENNIVYSNNIWYGKLYAVYIRYKNQFINYLIAKRVNTLFKKCKDFFKNPEKLKSLSFKTNEISHLSNDEIKKLNPINLNNTEYLFLKKPINDFIYSSNNHVNNISVFNTSADKNIFFIRGEKRSTKLTYQVG